MPAGAIDLPDHAYRQARTIVAAALNRLMNSYQPQYAELADMYQSPLMAMTIVGIGFAIVAPAVTGAARQPTSARDSSAYGAIRQLGVRLASPSSALPGRGTPARTR